MWLLNSWFFKLRYHKLPFIIDNICQTFQSDCRADIKKDFEKITARYPHTLTRLKLKDAKERMHATYTSIVGKRVTLTHPIFTANEVEKLKTNRKIYLLVLGLLLFFEAILYSSMGTLLIPRKIQEFIGVEWLFGFAFALIFVAALHFSYKNLWTFVEAKHIIETDSFDKKELKRFYPNLALSLIILFLFIVTNIATGYIRAVIFDPSSGSSDPLMETIKGPLLIFSIIATFMVALVMALLEKDISEKSEKYKIYKNWAKQQRERKEYNTEIRRALQRCNEVMRAHIEKYWNLLKDVQRVLKREVDEEHRDLYKAFRNQLSDHTLDLSTIDAQTYRKFSPVAATSFELFRYGVESNPSLQAQLDELRESIAEIEKFEDSFVTKEDNEPIARSEISQQQSQEKPNENDL